MYNLTYIGMASRVYLYPNMSCAKNGQGITIGKGLLVMKIFDNITDIVRDDLKETIQRGSKVSIAAACFSMYAYKELKRQLEQV